MHQNLAHISVAFWGTPPPPIGGMTVHLQRLIKKIELEELEYIMYNFNNHEYESHRIINVRKKVFWYFGLYFNKNPKIHYVISTRTMIRFLAVIFGKLRNKKIIIRVGGESLANSMKSFWQKIFSKYAIRNADIFIGVNKDIHDLAQKIRTPKDTLLIPGFIPPFDSGELPPREIIEFYKGADIKLAVSGQVFEPEDFDIYGLWDIIKVMKLLKENFENPKVVIFKYSVKTKEYSSNSFNKKIKKLGLINNIFIYNSKIELWPTLKYCDVFLRPSYTDGDANSIRESLYFETPVVASNVVKRPAQTIVYESGNIRQLANGIMRAFNSDRIDRNRIKDNSKNIVSIIKKFDS